LGIDPDTTKTTATLAWSFSDEGNRYLINGRSPVDLGTEDPVDCPGKMLDEGVDPLDGDSSVRTITFRDGLLSPIGGDKVEPTSSGIVGSSVVTLWCSDGIAATSRSFTVWTENGGTDRLSGSPYTPAGPGGTAIPTPTSSTWSSASIIETGATATITGASNHLCMQSPLVGDVLLYWVAPYGIVELKQNVVYKFHLTLGNNGNYSAEFAYPLWDFALENVITNDAANTQSKYSADFLCWDNEHGANSPGLASGGRSDFEVWYTPMCVNSADWNSTTNGEFQSSFDAYNDMRCFLRILDVQNSSLLGDTDAGTLCLDGFEVTSYPIADLTVSQTLWSETNLTTSNFHATDWYNNAFSPTAGAHTTLSTANGDFTLTPYIGGVGGENPWSLSLNEVAPGSGTTAPTTSEAAKIATWYPIVWESNKLLRATVVYAAPNATAESNPPDAYMFSWNAFTSEIAVDNYLTSAKNAIGFPKVGTPIPMVNFLYTLNKTKTTFVNGDRLRFRAGTICTAGIYSAGGNAYNLGGYSVQSFACDEMVYPWY